MPSFSATGSGASGFSPVASGAVPARTKQLGGGRQVVQPPIPQKKSLAELLGFAQVINILRFMPVP